MMELTALIVLLLGLRVLQDHMVYRESREMMVMMEQLDRRVSKAYKE